MRVIGKQRERKAADRRGDLQFLGKLLEGGLLGLIDHNFHHLLADELALGALGVAGGADLAASSLGEANAEHTEEVSVGSLGLDKGLNSGVPLLDDGAELVAGDIHSVEVGVAVEALDFFDLHLHLSPSLFVAVSVQISQRYLKHTASQAVSGDLYIITKWIRTSSIWKNCSYSDRQFCCKE